MGSGTTPRLQWPYPKPADPSNVPGDVQALADAADAETVIFLTPGTLGSRPAAGKGGQVYWTTDTLEAYYDNGVNWVRLNMIFTQGTLAARPVTNIANALYYATDVNQFYYNTGSGWSTIGLLLSSSAPAAVGQTSSAGGGTQAERAGHVHQGVTSLTGAPGVSISGGDGSHGALTISHGPIAVAQYAPASQAAYSYHFLTAPGSLAALDTTNLTVAFTAPPSGKVLVQLTGYHNNGVAQDSNGYFSSIGWWGLFLHNTSTQVGNTSLVSLGFSPTNGGAGDGYSFAAVQGGSGIKTCYFYITGLAAGTSYQYDWAAAQYNGRTSLGTSSLEVVGSQGADGGSGNEGPALMIVWAA